MFEGHQVIQKWVQIISLAIHNLEKNKTNAPDPNSKYFITALVENSYHSLCTYEQNCRDNISCLNAIL